MKICCLGASNIDIIVNCTQPLSPDDSLLSNIDISIGGVGNNIAYNLSAQKIFTKFITVISNDVFGKYIINSLDSEYLDLSDIQIHGHNSSFYIGLNGSNYNYGFNDMRILNHICPSKILNSMQLLSGYDYVLIDLNLPINILELIFNNCNIPIVCDATSITKCVKISPYLNRINTLKCNINEARKIVSSISQIKSYPSVDGIAKSLLDNGVSNVYITKGQDGAMFYNDEIRHMIKPFKRCDKNPIGAGDAFTSGIIFGQLQKWSPQDILLYASYLAFKTIQGDSMRIKESDVIELSKIKELADVNRQFAFS
jgi:pseudouridine kinase